MDPAALMLAATIAAVHITWLILRRHSVPFQAGRLWRVAGFFFLCLVTWPFFQSDPDRIWTISWMAVLPVSCAAILLTRMESGWICAVAAVTGLTLSIEIHNTFSKLIGKGDYVMSRKSYWKEDQWGAGPSQVVTDLKNSRDRTLLPKGKLSAGYLDEILLPDDFRVFPGPLHWVHTAPEWHSLFTGLNRYQVRSFRIWTEGGDPTRAADRLWLVPWDQTRPTVKGTEKEVGVPLNRLVGDPRH